MLLDNAAEFRRRRDGALGSPLGHTQNAVYLTTIFALGCIFYDSTQGIIQRFSLNKKWFYLYGAMCAFAYLYTRPLIRRRFGSASRGYINWTTIYAVWLCAAVFYHLPSLDTLGLDVKADLSMFITVFLGSIAVLGSVSGAYGIGILFRLVSPRLLDRTSGAKDAFTTVILNSWNLAIACSSYYSLCGNGPTEGGMAGDAVRSAVCGRWLHPLSAIRHPAFSGWVIYGEPANNGTTIAALDSNNIVDTAAAGTMNISSIVELEVAASSHAISPVFTTWLTLFAMVLVNSVAEYAAGAAFGAAYSLEARREMSAKRRAASFRRRRRRRSAEYPSDRPRSSTMSSYASLGFLSRPGSTAAGLDALLKTVSSVGSLWSPTALETVGLKAASALLFRDDFGVGLTPSPAIDGVSEATPVPDSLLADPMAAAGVGLVVDPNAPAPSFLPMFPWYSGTSADLLKTMFDLVVSVKVFLGRFDQRTMQAATANASDGGAAAASSTAAPPHDGDGFTYEHLAGHEEVWIDFTADTGDGGDSTYSVARCLAATKVTVTLPPEMAAAAGAPPHLASSTTRVLPRAQCLVHGGDLAYPNPTDETYEQRLFGPYQDAFPPPAQIHPGNLVVNKPDLPSEYWEAGTRSCMCTHVSSQQQYHLGGGPQGGVGSGGGGHRSGLHRVTQPCPTCRKAATLAAYDGPSAFLIPGNHDWIDGLETFTRHVVHKGWLGGWLLPQEKSYFALRLPRGWWIFAMDLALVDDLDMSQYRYFARIAEERMGPNDAAVVVSHAPQWLINWFWGRHEGKNLRQLLRGPLRGRARVHLCGDLHFYMRHSFKPYARDGSSANGGGISGITPPASELSTPAGGSPLGGGSPTSSQCPTPLPALGSLHTAQGNPQGNLHHQTLLNKLKTVHRPGSASGSVASPLPGSSPGISAVTLGKSPGVGWSDDEVSSLGTSPPDLGLGTGAGGGGGGGLGISAGGVNGINGGAVTAPVGAAGAAGGLPPLPPHISWHNPLALPSSPPSTTAAHQLMGTSPTNSASHGWWPSLRVKTPRPDGTSPREDLFNNTSNLSGRPGGTAAAAPTAIAGTTAVGNGGLRRNAFSVSGMSVDGEWDAPPPGWILNDPEHLIVCGSGGAFLHPTHVFNFARFRPPHDPAAGPMYLRPPAQPAQDFPASALGMGGGSNTGGGGGSIGIGAGGLGITPQVSSLAGALKDRDREFLQTGPSLRRGFPSDSSLHSRAAAMGAAPPQQPAGGEYRCQAAFPSAEQSLRLGRANLHTFRHVNSRFDVIGGALYYLLVVSVLPRCSGVADILDAHSVREVLRLFAAAAWNTVVEILNYSYISLAALAFLFLVTFGFAGSGGVGAITGVPPAARRKPEYRGFALAVRARLGGLPAQITYAAAHTAAHLSAAITLLLLLELGVETVMRYEGVGRDGYHSLYNWFRSFEAEHFPDPAGVRSTLSTLTLGLYPNVIKWAFAAFDVPEVIAVSRTVMCAAGGTAAALTRLQTLGYYTGVLLYFWVLATPTVGLIFGLYLYVSGNWLHVHYDESFSALQVEHHKGFLRMHVTTSGDLEIFALGLEESPSVWREDPRWRGSGGGGAPGVTSAHRTRWPSRWTPVTENTRAGGRKRIRTATPPESQLKVVDYIYVPKQAQTT